MDSGVKRRRRTRDEWLNIQHCEGCVTRDTQIKELQGQIHELQKSTDEWKRLYMKETAAKDEALTRLSAIISSSIRENNPNICDLSDENRPTKIAERMSELYDNQWTDAYDEIGEDESRDEETKVKILLDILMVIYKECLEWANNDYFGTVQGTIECSYKGEHSGINKQNHANVLLPIELRCEIKQFRKRRALAVLPSIHKMLSERVPLYRKDVYQTPAMRRYITGCEQVCWLAAIQDPPLAIEDESPIEYRRNLFRGYTSSGPHVQYVVWPLLRLCKDGAVMSKGVAQCCHLTPQEKELKYTERSIKNCSVK